MRRSKARPAFGSRFFQPTLEPLEDRRLLATLDLVGSTLTFTLDAGATDAALSGSSAKLAFDAGSGHTITANAGARALGFATGSQTTGLGNLNGVTQVRIVGAAGSGQQLHVNTLSQVTVASLSIDSSIDSTLLATSVTTSGDQFYGGAVTLVADSTVTGSNITFAATIDSDSLDTPRKLSVQASQKSWLERSIGLGANGVDDGGTGDDRPLSSLELTALTRLGDGTDQATMGILSTGSQGFGAALILAADTTLHSSAGANVTFASTVDSSLYSLPGNTTGVLPQSLTVVTDGTTEFRGAVGTKALKSITTLGGTTLLSNGSITTTLGQTFGAMIAGANVMLTSYAGGNITLHSTDNNGTSTLFFLSTNTSGLTSFLGNVGLGANGVDDGGAGDDRPLSSLRVSGQAAFGSGGAATAVEVLTQGSQSFGSDVILAADTTFASITAGDLSFAGAVAGDGNSPRSLSLRTTGAKTFGGAIGDPTMLPIQAAYDSSAPAAAALATPATSTPTPANITAILAAIAALNAEGNIQRPIVNPGAGVPPAGSISGATASGSLSLNGGNQYGGGVFLNAGGTLTGYASNSVLIIGLGGAPVVPPSFSPLPWTGAAINSTTSFNGATYVNVVPEAAPAQPPLGAISTFTSSGGSVLLRGGFVHTLGAQSYDQVILGADTAFFSNGDTTFTSLIGSDASSTPRAMLVAAAGMTRFVANVGYGASDLPLATLSVSGAATLGSGAVGSTFRINAQSWIGFDGRVTLAADTTLAGSNAFFRSTIDGDGVMPRDLTIATPMTAFYGVIGSTVPLGDLTAPDTRLIQGSVTTIGNQHYGSLTLTTDTVLKAGGSIWSNATSSAVASELHSLTLNATAETALTSASNLSSLAISGPAWLSGAIRTSGSQSYGGPIQLRGNTTLDSSYGLVNLLSSVSSATAGAFSFAVTETGGLSFTWNAGTLWIVDPIAGDSLDVTFANATDYTLGLGGGSQLFHTNQLNTVEFTGAATDTVTVVDRFNPLTATFSPGSFVQQGSAYNLLVTGPQTVQSTGSALGVAILLGTGAGDVAVSSYQYSAITNANGLSNRANGMHYVYLTEPAGATNTVANLYDTPGNDSLIAAGSVVTLAGSGFTEKATGFNAVYAASVNGGADSARLNDTAGHAKFVSTSAYAYLAGPGYFNQVQRFASVIATTTQGSTSTAAFYGTARAETFTAGPTSSRMQGSGMNVTATGFGQVTVKGGGGKDVIRLNDSSGNDALSGSKDTIKLKYGSGVQVTASGFRQVTAARSAGTDSERLAAVDYTFTGMGGW